MSQRLPTLLLITLISLILSLPHAKALWAQSPSETMPLANQLYEEGHFSEAAQSYQQLVDIGVEHSNLYYNLGNAYFKLGELGRAILNYKRAAQLNPRDGDIHSNLELARSQRTDRYEQTDTSALSLLVTFTSTWLTLDETALIALTLWGLLILLLLIYRHSRASLRRAVQNSLLLITPLFILALLSLSGRLYLEQTKPQGVIISQSVDITSGPGEQYVTQFTLHSGAEVILIEKRGTWARLSLPGDQLQGWVPAETVEAVNRDW